MNILSNCGWGLSELENERTLCNSSSYCKKTKGYMVAQKTLASFRERMNQLYEQGADFRCWA